MVICASTLGECTKATSVVMGEGTGRDDDTSRPSTSPSAFAVNSGGSVKIEFDRIGIRSPSV